METWTVAEWLTNYAISVLVGQFLSSVVLSRSATAPTSKDIAQCVVCNLVWPIIVVGVVLVALARLELYLLRRTPDKPFIDTSKFKPMDPELKDCLETYSDSLTTCIEALGHYQEGQDGERAKNAIAVVESSWRAFNARQNRPT